MHFPVSGVEVSPLVPPLVAFVVSAITSTGGVSGAFLLLPFQVSVLGFSSPAVSPTNHIYNIVAIPGGLYRYIREKRMAWPLTWVVLIGTLPGVIIGSVVRVKYLPDPANFKIFMGCVLAYIGGRLFLDASGLVKRDDSKLKALEKSFQERYTRSRESGAAGADVTVRTVSVSAREVVYEFYGERFSFNPATLFVLALIVGVVGGAYGIGGGAIIAPFVMTFFRLPVYTIAGAALMGTFVTSIIGVGTFYAIGMFYTGSEAIRPDWLLGLMFGVGGLAGTYAGARIQKYIPGGLIRIILAVSILFLAVKYVWESFL